MKLIIKPNRGFGKIEVEVTEELWREIERLGEGYGVSPEGIIEMALAGQFGEPEGVLEELERKAEELEREAWRIEKKYASLRYKAYGLSEDNKVLAIELSGLIAENNQLRRFLRLPLNRNPELRKLISYYLQG